MKRFLGLGLSLALVGFAGCGDDDAGSCVDNDGDGYGVNCDLGDDCDDNDDTIHTGCTACVDADGDGHDVYDADDCPAGDDECDGDANNWTTTGCADCVDGDGDGYGVDCDMGTDCDDADNTIHTGCGGCEDLDGDGHDAYDATECPTGDDVCDSDGNNWTATGCADCVDGDGDGYGVDCDMGTDCDDTDNTIHTGCAGCEDLDNDGHDGYDATTCPAGDDQCDGDANNWTTTGCTSCVDGDGDGYGTDCDLGDDCNDSNPNQTTVCQSVFYRGDFATDNSDDVGIITYPGPTMTVLPLPGLDHSAFIDGLALSPDGSLIAVSGEDINGDNVLQLYTADGTSLPVTLAIYSEAWDVDMDQLAFSPDGAWVAFRADVEISGGDAIYVVPTDGSAPPKLVTQVPASSSFDVSSFAWSPDTSGTARYLAYRGDMASSAVYGLWVVEITAATPAPVEIESADVSSALAFDSQGRLYYRLQITGVYQLWRSDLTGTTKEQVPGTVLTNADGEASIGAIGMSPSGTKLAFSADVPTGALYEVYVLDLATTTPVLVSSTAALTPTAGDISGPGTFAPISWSPDETMLAVVADWQLAAGESDNDYSAYILPVAAPAGGVRLLRPLPAATNRDVNDIYFSSDSLRVFVRADLVDNNDTEIYTTIDLTTAEQDPATLLIQDVVSGGDVDALVVP